jgi:hypothetical protein
MKIGLPPFHYIREHKKVHKAVQKGPVDPSYLTNGTVVESHMHQIMKDCFQMDHRQRISMQEVVSSLQRLSETVA